MRSPMRIAQYFLAAGLVLAAMTSVVAIHSAAAADPIQFTPEVPIPGLIDKTTTVDRNFLGIYIRAVYVYFIWIVGILAGVMIVWGGIKWVGAAGNPARINDARDTINSAIIGIIIALVSVVMLNIINPNLTRIGLPDLPGINGSYFYGAAATDFCSPDQGINCGDLQPMNRTVTDANGKEVPEYCMGTICKNIWEVCPLVVTTLPGYKASPSDFTGDFVVYSPSSTGCTRNIQLAGTQGNYTKPADYADIQSLESGADATFAPTLICGKVYRSRKMVGSACPNSNKAACYIALTPAQIVDHPGDNNDILRKMACPQ